MLNLWIQRAAVNLWWGWIVTAGALASAGDGQASGVLELPAGSAPAVCSAPGARLAAPPRAGWHEIVRAGTRTIFWDPDDTPGLRWPADVLVTDPTFDQVEPAIAKAPDGTLFIAAELLGDWDGCLGLYRSTDGGASWSWLLIHCSLFGPCRNPSLAYAVTPADQDWLYLAYERSHDDSTKDIMVSRYDPDDLSTSDVVSAADGINGMSAFDIYPRVCTDNLHFSGYYVYVTYTINLIDYFPVMFTRSLDYGLTYEEPQNLTGSVFTMSGIIRPDVAYGSAGLFVAFEKQGWTGSTWEKQVWVTRSSSYGTAGSWDEPQQLTTSSHGAWHPSVAVAHGNPTVMVAYTRDYGSDTDVRCSCSTDGGESYEDGALPWTFENEKGVALVASDSGGLFHAAYWHEYDVLYTYTPVASPLPWAGATVVNDVHWASAVYPRPAICVNPTRPLANEASIAWTDFRGGGFYDVYFDTAPICIGDMNCDGQVDLRDINAFTLYLSNQAGWSTAFPGCNPVNGDINSDAIYGQGSLADINPFVALLSGGPLPLTCP